MTKDLRIEKFGEVFTLPIVVSEILDAAHYTVDKNLGNVSVLEPSAGDGAFAVEIIKRLKASSNNFKFDFSNSLSKIYFVEIDLDNVSVLIDRLRIECQLSDEELSLLNIINQDFLFTKFSKQFDLIVGNPPYVRWDNIESEYRKKIKSEFQTFRGRCDLYIPFYEQGLRFLSSTGALIFICSNRWFKSAYGKQLRKLVTLCYNISRIIDLESTNPFTSDVLGYPAITIINRRGYTSTNYTKIDNLKDISSVGNSTTINLRIYKDSPWSFDNTYNQLLETKYFTSIKDSGYDIKIGVATGKDAIFIGDDFDGKVESNRLVNLIKAQHLKGKEVKSPLKVINSFDSNNKLVDLSKFPMLKSYLEANKDILSQRHIAKRDKKYWYRTIDKIRIEDIFVDKILLPDIAGSSKIVLGGKGYYPHHNIYYLTTKLGKLHLEVLAGILSSSFIFDQLKAIGNKMNGGYPRWQSQNIKRLVVPNILSMSSRWTGSMAEAYRLGLNDQINELMAFDSIKANFEDEISFMLFEPEQKYSRNNAPPSTG